MLQFAFDPPGTNQPCFTTIAMHRCRLAEGLGIASRRHQSKASLVALAVPTDTFDIGVLLNDPLKLSKLHALVDRFNDT